MKKLFFLLIVFSAFQFGNAQDTLVFESEFLEKNDSVLIFIPEDYSASEQFPLVYMLHGYGGDFKQWSEITDLQNLSNEYGFVIACPDGQFDSWYFDSPRMKKSKFESFFTQDLYPQILESYKIDKENVFITGLSMGGHGAFYLFLKNLELFNSAASTSGVLDLNQSSLKYSSLSDKLGEYNLSKELFDKYSSINLLDTIRFSTHSIFFDCGYDDHLYKSNLEFWNKAKELKVDAIFKQSAGRHTRDYWQKSIIWHFVFFENQLKN